MSRSLISRLQDNLNHFDFAAMNSTAEELRYLRSHRDHVARLMSYEGKYAHEQFVDDALNGHHDGAVSFRKVSTTPLHAECLFKALTVCTEYDHPRDFSWELLGNEYLNYFAKLRDSYTDPLVYGPAERWCIWSTGPGAKLNRVEVTGRLSALHMNFPDKLTATLARDAGVNAADFAVPLLTLRIGKRSDTISQFRQRNRR